MEELENYAKQVEELQEMGNIKELPRYHKKAQHLEQKLTQAADRVREKSCFFEVFELYHEYDRSNNSMLKKNHSNGTQQVIQFVNKL